MTEARGRDDVPRGFAGLTSLVSDIDQFLDEVETQPLPAPASGETEPSNRSEEARSHKTGPTPVTASDPDGHGEGWAFGLGVAAVLALALWLAASTGSSSGPRSTSSPPSPPRNEASAPDPAAPTVPRTSESSSVPPATTASPTFDEDLPPVGTDHILSVAQIRYCLAESMRIDAADPLVDVTVARDVERFNEMVDDFNSRCSAYRYWDGTLRQAEDDVAAHREAILREGRRRFGSGS